MPLQPRPNAGRIGAMLAVALAAASLAEVAAATETVQLRYASPADALVTQVHLPLGTQSYYVGNYMLQTVTPASSFQGYCVDPFRHATTAFLGYEKSALANFLSGSPQKLADVRSLFGHAYAGTIVGNATKAAGFQLALWEVFNDDRNLASGSVSKTVNTNAAAVAEANGLLASLAGADWTTPQGNYELTMYSNAQAQSYLAATPYLGSSSVQPLPEPETFVLMLVGLLGLLGWASRSRKTPGPQGSSLP